MIAGPGNIISVSAKQDLEVLVGDDGYHFSAYLSDSSPSLVESHWPMMEGPVHVTKFHRFQEQGAIHPWETPRLESSRASKGRSGCPIVTLPSGELVRCFRVPRTSLALASV